MFMLRFILPVLLISLSIFFFFFYVTATTEIYTLSLHDALPISASRYEPGVNRTYQDLAAHYGTTVMPTRPRKPRDKAKVEGAVLIVERWILARLRNHRFFSLVELNAAIRALVEELNMRLM